MPTRKTSSSPAPASAAPPVGGNLVSVGREAIEETGAINVQQILKTVPAITGIGSGGVGQNAGNSLLCADHPQPRLVGIEFDPGADRWPSYPARPHVAGLAGSVDRPADHARARRGPRRGLVRDLRIDAVAGVVNFITRKRYDGVMGTAQAGFGHNYRTVALGLLGGKSWDSGYVTLGLGFSCSSAVPYDW